MGKLIGGGLAVAFFAGGESIAGSAFESWVMILAGFAFLGLLAQKPRRGIDRIG